MNLFLDTNVWLRYFVGDNENHLKLAKHILELSDKSQIRVSTSTFVLSEFVYVESSFYKISKKDIVVDLKTIKSVKKILIVEKTDFNQALEYYKSSKSESLKWSDCVIAAQVPPNYKLCSFDKDLAKLIGGDRFVYPLEVNR